jgi:hypothetical protein
MAVMRGAGSFYFEGSEIGWPSIHGLTGTPPEANSNTSIAGYPTETG